jgi:hypothetical protein
VDAWQRANDALLVALMATGEIPVGAAGLEQCPIATFSGR